jgi:glycosyltransferase involved in cell wall biosynthesis
MLFKVRGGIQRFNQMLCLALDRLAPALDLDVAVLSQDDSIEDYRASGTAWRHLEFVPCGGQAGVMRKAVAMCYARRPDGLLMALLGMTPVGVACRPALRCGFGFVAHGVEAWHEPRFSRRFCARRARVAFAVSRHTAQALTRATGLPASRVRILHNTLAPGFESMAGAAPESSTEPPELLTVSRLWAEEKQKGVDHTIRALARLTRTHPHVRYRVVGKGSDLGRLQALAASEGVADRVRFEQDLTDDELAERYRRSAAFVLPSAQEGFGIVFLEAMRFSRPCIGSPVGGIPEVIDDGRTGLLVPFGNEEQLATAIARLVDDRELRVRMGTAAHQRLLDLFVFDKFEAQLRGHLADWLGV